MGKYLLQRDLLIDPVNLETAHAGEVIELTDKDQIEKLLGKGTIVEAGEGVSVTPRLSAFEAAQQETAERNSVANQELNDQAQREAEAQKHVEEQRAKLANAPAQTVEGEANSNDPLVQEQPASDSEETQAPSVSEPQAVTPVAGQPTPSEIEATLEATGQLPNGSESSQVDVQIS